MHRFKDLEIWKISRAFCSEIYLATDNFPEREKFGITNQMRRAAVSIPSNIAEGCSRKSNKELSRFLEIAVGSCYELETQLLITNDLGYLPIQTRDLLISQLEKIINMTVKFMFSLKFSSEQSNNRTIE